MERTRNNTMTATITPSQNPLAAAAAANQKTLWKIDSAHSAAHFSVRHMMIANVRGEFGRMSGSVQLDAADLTKSNLEVSVETASVNTREPQRDEHLRSADFFDVALYPTMTFRSRTISAAGPGHFQVSGDLTIRGVTREVAFDIEGPTPAVKDPWGNWKVGVNASAKINRKDFGLVWNALLEGGGIAVGETVSIT